MRSTACTQGCECVWMAFLMSLALTKHRRTCAAAGPCLMHPGKPAGEAAARVQAQGSAPCAGLCGES